MKVRYIVLICICIICAAACIYLNYLYTDTMKDDTEELEALRDEIKKFDTASAVTDTVYAPDVWESETVPKDTETETVTDAVTEATPEAFETEAVTEAEQTTVTETEAVTEAVPVQPSAPVYSLDFDSLHELNPDIYAWIEIPGTMIDYPVLQSATDDKKYLTTAYDGRKYIGGALFTESSCNSLDFNDPVTVIYGHTMRSGALFGKLQKSYSTAKSFEKYQKIKIYLPGDVRSYTVFAAVPYDSIHLLHTYDFTVRYWYESFFADVRKIRAIGASFDEDIFPEAGDRVIILSVCLNEDTSRRFLVMAVYDKDLADNTVKS